MSVAATDSTGATAAVLLGAAWLGSMLPDADLAGARVYRRTRIERRVPLLRPAAALLRLPIRLLTLLPHRGPTHSILACVLATLLTGVLVSLADPDLARAAAIGMAIGYAAHLAADACTPAGVPAWAPFSRRRHWMLPAGARIKTGSMRESLGLVVLTALLLAVTLPLLG